MHELSICQSIIGIVEKHADGRGVRTVNVRIGTLRQIVPDTLVYCWSLVTEGSELEGAELNVERVQALLHCDTCGHEQTLDVPILICESCSGQQVTLVSGDEFLITSLELEDAGAGRPTKGN